MTTPTFLYRADPHDRITVGEAPGGGTLVSVGWFGIVIDRDQAFRLAGAILADRRVMMDPHGPDIESAEEREERAQAADAREEGR